MARSTHLGRLRRGLHYSIALRPFMSHPRRVPELNDIIRAYAPDLVLFYLPNLCHLSLTLPLDLKCICILEEDWSRDLSRSLGDLHPIKRQIANVTERKRVHRLYRAVGKRAAGVVVISEEERQFLSAFIAQDKIAVLDHGIDCRYFSPTAASEKDSNEQWDVLVVANFTQNRNVRGLKHIAEALRSTPLENRPKLRWAVVGSGSEVAVAEIFSELQTADTFLAAGRVSDVRPYYRATKIVVVPDAEGTGVKTTVLQGWAMERPVVAMTAAARGLPAQPNLNILTATSAVELLRHITCLYADPDLRGRVGQAGRSAAVQWRDIRRIAVDLLQYCNKHLADSGS